MGLYFLSFLTSQILILRLEMVIKVGVSNNDDCYPLYYLHEDFRMGERDSITL